MKLDDLPNFKATRREDHGDQVHLFGRFDDLAHVVDSRSWLLTATEAYCGDLEEVDLESQTAIFKSWDDEFIPKLFDSGIGWMHGRYNPSDVWKVLDQSSVWLEAMFRESDAIARDLEDGWRELTSVDAVRVSDSEGLLSIVPNGWDHEHCFICNIHIDADEPKCYTSPFGNGNLYWVCPLCYSQWIEPHDIGFIYAQMRG